MNRILIAAFTVALLCGGPASRSASAQTATANGTSGIAPGSVIPVQLTKTVDAKKVKTGDEVVAKVTVDLKNNAGTVIVPKDTKVVGHITEAQARSKDQKESEVAITFDRVVIKNGEPMQVPMSIQAIIAPPNANSANSAGSQPTSSSPEPGGAATGPGTRSGSMGGTTPPAASLPQTTGSAPISGAQAQQPITGNTKGVVGIANLSLSTAADTPQGSVVSSEKNNVKLDDGTFLLLRVNQ